MRRTSARLRDMIELICPRLRYSVDNYIMSPTSLPPRHSTHGNGISATGGSDPRFTCRLSLPADIIPRLRRADRARVVTSARLGDRLGLDARVAACLRILYHLIRNFQRGIPEFTVYFLFPVLKCDMIRFAKEQTRTIQLSSGVSAFRIHKRISENQGDDSL